MNINNNINYLRQKVPAHCTLIAVSKTQPVSKIHEAYAAGQRHFGENKVQELVSKSEQLPGDIRWHMIGHLQSNKVKYIAPFVSLIHGVDSVKLLNEIDRQAQKNQRIIPCLLQVFIAQEETKFGFSEEEILSLLETNAFSKFPHVEIHGLMGMATFTENREQIRNEFRKLRHLFEKLRTMLLPHNVKMQELSMGMSGDFDIAIEEGSTMIRIGTAIFGERAIHHE